MNNDHIYVPHPLNTSGVTLSGDLSELTELMACNTHEVWARERMAQGWKYGIARNDEKKEHPCLVPYHELPEEEKAFDRQTSLETLKLIVSLGYCINNKQ